MYPPRSTPPHQQYPTPGPRILFSPRNAKIESLKQNQLFFTSSALKCLVGDVQLLLQLEIRKGVLVQDVGDFKRSTRPGRSTTSSARNSARHTIPYTLNKNALVQKVHGD